MDVFKRPLTKCQIAMRIAGFLLAFAATIAAIFYTVAVMSLVLGSL